MKQFLFCLFFVVSAFCLTAQNLYMPRNLQQAYKKGTRSMDGKPGKNYWQNKARYDINITALPPDRVIRGKEKIVYINNSPDTIRTPGFKLFLNIHKPGVSRLGDASDNYLTNGMKIDKFQIAGKDVKWDEPTFNSTNKTVRLPTPLLPGDSLTFNIDWHFTISLESGREGMLDNTTFFMAYIYPRVAVYDDYYGWDRVAFVDALEFYNDFNDYNVTINAPKNYLVWGTGTLLNVKEVLQPSFAQKFNQSLYTDEVMNIVTSSDLAAKNYTVQNEINSWKWKATNIPDVTFALSDHYVWDASSVVVDNNTQRRASVQAAYIDTAKDFRQMVSFSRYALNWFSNNWPGVPYPYEKMTVVQGTADMEYPMMVNDNTTDDIDFSRFVAEHEIAHTWFPFYMGINENRWGFMDEGWATTFELLIGRSNQGKERAEQNYKRFRVTNWTLSNNAEVDVPIITPGNVLSGLPSGNNQYGRASVGYFALMDLLGEDVFKKCLQAFIERWNGKHPTPWDMFYTFNDISGKNLNWFWNNWFFSRTYIDYGLKDVKPSSTGTKFILQNIGGCAAPVDAIIKYTDGTTETKHFSPDNWQAKTEIAVVIISKKKVESIKIDGGIFMDADSSNNNWINSK